MSAELNTTSLDTEILTDEQQSALQEVEKQSEATGQAADNAVELGIPPEKVADVVAQNLGSAVMSDTLRVVRVETPHGPRLKKRTAIEVAIVREHMQRLNIPLPSHSTNPQA